MEELTRSSGRTIAPAAKAESKKKLGVADAVGLITGAIGAFDLLTKTDLNDIVGKVKAMVNNDLVTVGLIAVFTYLAVGAVKHADSE